jgi:hypothetical protein
MTPARYKAIRERLLLVDADLVPAAELARLTSLIPLDVSSSRSE